jgi:hypothetical protein
MPGNNLLFPAVLFCAVLGLAMASTENSTLCGEGKIIVARGHGGHGGGHGHGNGSGRNSKSNEAPHSRGGSHGSSEERKWDEAPPVSPESNKPQPNRGPETHNRGTSGNLVQLAGEWI